MQTDATHLDVKAAEARLLRFLSIDRVSGREGAICSAIGDELRGLGVPASAIRHDDAARTLPSPSEVGNLLVDLAGTRAGPRLLFSAHLDTVPLCKGARPRRNGDRIVSDGTTALGGDNGTGCAALVALAETLLRHRLPHPPITLLFTVREEIELQGARALQPRDLGGAAMGFNVDSSRAAELILGAVGKEAWQAEVRGVAAHAAIAPEKGVSALLVASIALAEAQRAGWLGKVVKPEGAGSSNPGIFGGRNGEAAGDATNVVTDYVKVVGEARSLDATFAKTITEGYRQGFASAEAEVKSATGARASVSFETRTAYPPFLLGDNCPPLSRAQRAATAIGLEPSTLISSGGLDANWLVAHGVPTVTFGAGQAEIHSVDEYVDLKEFERGCRLAVALATLED